MRSTERLSEYAQPGQVAPLTLTTASNPPKSFLGTYETTGGFRSTHPIMEKAATVKKHIAKPPLVLRNIVYLSPDAPTGLGIDQPESRRARNRFNPSGRVIGKHYRIRKGVID